ncbi:DUF6879 family protein [Streptomyces chartreusis]|uniref:DUF6879 family protein n=1 Tax=Streptomyces chartreusis TaxID=1969 RepID=UPI00364CFD77
MCGIAAGRTAAHAPCEAGPPSLPPRARSSYRGRRHRPRAHRPAAGRETLRGSEAWARWKAGENVAHDEPDSWRRNVTEQVAQGKTFGRVRIVDRPFTEGQEFLLTRAPSNKATGDEVRYLWRADAVRLGLPDFDFWLIDSRTLLRFVFDEQHSTMGVIVSEDPAEVLAAYQARDAAWQSCAPRPA